MILINAVNFYGRQSKFYVRHDVGMIAIYLNI